MGQIANDIIDGYCCSLCGTYFTKEHGYPVICKDCWKSLSKKERKQYQLAAHEEIYQ